MLIYLWLLISFKNNPTHLILVFHYGEFHICTKAENSTMNSQYTSSFNNCHPSLLHHIFLKNPVQFSYTISHILNFSRCQLSCSSASCMSCKLAIRSKKLDKLLYFWLVISPEEAHDVCSVLVMLHFVN